MIRISLSGSEAANLATAAARCAAFSGTARSVGSDIDRSQEKSTPAQAHVMQTVRRSFLPAQREPTRMYPQATL